MSEDTIKVMSGVFIVSAGHTHPETLSDGRTVAPGEPVTQVPEADQRLVDEGILIPGHEGVEAVEVNATPAAVEKAAELQVDILSVSGTGQDGRITVEDVERTADAQDDEEVDSNG